MAPGPPGVLSRLLAPAIAAYGSQALFAAIFVPLQTEKYYDFCGSLGFLSALAASLYYPALKTKFLDKVVGATIPALRSFAPRQLLMSAVMLLWTSRLGIFLLAVSASSLFLFVFPTEPDHQRSLKHGGDSRFVKIRKNAAMFTFAWFMQG